MLWSEKNELLFFNDAVRGWYSAMGLSIEIGSSLEQIWSDFYETIKRKYSDSPGEFSAFTDGLNKSDFIEQAVAKYQHSEAYIIDNPALDLFLEVGKTRGEIVLKVPFGHHVVHPDGFYKVCIGSKSESIHFREGHVDFIFQNYEGSGMGQEFKLACLDSGRSLLRQALPWTPQAFASTR